MRQWLLDIPRKHLWVALSMATANAFLLGGYEFIRSPSNTLFKAAYGVENMPIVMALMPLGIIATLFIYGQLVSWCGTRRTLMITTMGSGVIIVCCYLAIRFGCAPATGLLYIVREAYVVLIIEQYWSFVNSSMSDTSARKLNGFFCGVGSLGAICGGMVVSRLAEPLGTLNLVLIAAALVIPTALISDIGFARCGEPKPTPVEKQQRHGGLGLKEFKNRPLRYLLIVVLITQIVSAVLMLRFQGILQITIPDADKQTAFSGGFFAWVNGGAAFLQFVMAPIMLRYFSTRAVHVFIPAIHIAACSVLLASPTLATAGAAYLIFKCFDYSIFRAAKELLYIPLSFDARYRTKEVIDVFGYRFGKGGMALLITFMQRAGLVFTSAYSYIALVAVAVWCGLAWPLTQQRSLTPRLSEARTHASHEP